MCQTWNACVAQLKGRISAADINNWVAPLHPVHRNDTLKLLAPNRYVLDYVKKNLLRLIEEIVLGVNREVRLVQVEIGEHSAAARPARADHQIVAAQHGKQLLQIGQRNALIVGDAFQRDRAARLVDGQVDHRGNGVTPFGGQAH